MAGSVMLNAGCPQCGAQNQMQLPSSLCGTVVTASCGGCGAQFQVQAPAPQRAAYSPGQQPRQPRQQPQQAPRQKEIELPPTVSDDSYDVPDEPIQAPNQVSMRAPRQQRRARGNLEALRPRAMRPKGCIGNCCVCVSPDELIAMERLGKFAGTRRGGCHFLGCDYGGQIIKIKKVSTRLQEIGLNLETKTKDHVFVDIALSLQVEVDCLKGFEAIYRLDNPQQQIESYVSDVVRGTVPTMNCDELFASKDTIAAAVKERLLETIGLFGYKILQVLVTDLRPDERVKNAMNQIEANRRLRIAMMEKAQAYAVQVVKAAEGDAEAQYLSGQGMARQRMAIVDGLKRDVGVVEPAMVQELMLITSYFDTLEKLSNGINTTVFMPHSVGYLGQIKSEVVAGSKGGGITRSLLAQAAAGAPGQLRMEDRPAEVASV